MIRSRYTEWLQGAINVIKRLFRRFGIMANVAKYKTMECQPGAIHTGMSEEAFSSRSKGGKVTTRSVCGVASHVHTVGWS